MKLAHLKVKTEQEETSPDSTREDADRYPEGMKIHMGHDEMDRMGLKETPSLGHKLHFEGHGVVVDGHQSPTDPEDRHIRVQFTHAGAESKAEEKPEKSLRGEIEESHKNAKPIVPREERLARAASKGRDAGRRPANAAEPPKGKAVGA